ncbi:MAG: RDD family protein [Patescibacteria group bacterium]
MKNVSITKRLASSVIDIVLIYAIIIPYILIVHDNLRYLWLFVYVFCFFIQSLTYLSMGRTLGERCLGLLVVSTNGYQPSKLKLLFRSLVKSSVFVP